MAPITKIFGSDSLFEKVFAGISCVCILFAAFAANKTIGLNNLKVDT